MEKKTCHITPNTLHTFTVKENSQTTRIDTILTQQFSEFSRSYFQRLLKNEHITCNNKIVKKPGTPVQAGDIITVHFPPAEITREPRQLPAELSVEIIYEHPDFLIINKPAGLIVHNPSHYHTGPTLVDWLMQHFQEISNVGSYDRPGIVHRLDQYTSGIMVIPRTNYAHATFGVMFHDRTIKKEYLAVVEGHPEPEGTIDFPISRDPNKRNQMTHKQLHGRRAVTHYTVIEYYQNATLVLVKPITGRTHQIRVHFAAIGHPIIGDTLYGTKSKYIKRQALHAHALSFTYQNSPFQFSCDPPEDMQKLIKAQKKLEN